MNKLLVIADDFTGSLDTGVQFAQRGAHTVVIPDSTELDIQGLDAGVQVLVVNTESRHMTPEAAYKRVFKITVEGLGAGFDFVYKKTDSALRGNIGSELTAVLDASPYPNIKFLPAFPKFKRATRGGIHYIDEVPVSKSVFGSDLFDPVRSSRVQEIIASQSKVDVFLNPADGERGIHVYDASTDEDLRAYGERFGAENLFLSAGCAGFAPVLADAIGIKAAVLPEVKLTEGLFVISGSLNPVSTKQVAYAEQKGIPRFILSGEQKTNPAWFEHQGASLVEQMIEARKSAGSCLVDVGTGDISESKGISGDALRDTISTSIGHLFKSVLDKGIDATLMCIGGDTLQALFRVAGISEISPVREMMQGVVLSMIKYKEKQYHLLTKSGGFGIENVIVELRNQCI